MNPKSDARDCMRNIYRSTSEDGKAVRHEHKDKPVCRMEESRDRKEKSKVLSD